MYKVSAIVRVAAQSTMDLLSTNEGGARMNLRLGLAAAVLFIAPVYGATLVESFDDITALPAAGWVLTNNSTPGGSTEWFQGNDAIFPAHSGAPDSYIAANLNAAPFGGDISLWLLTPTLTFAPGQLLRFWTRTDNSLVPDRLEIRLSTSGASSDVGSSPADVGDFATLLDSVNPALSSGGYPDLWTEYSVALPAAGSGRIALRYFVTDTSINGNYIGIDSFSVSGVPEPATWSGLITGFAAFAAIRLRHNRRRKSGMEV
jgi:hypothetical protein